MCVCVLVGEPTLIISAVILQVRRVCIVDLDVLMPLDKVLWRFFGTSENKDETDLKLFWSCYVSRLFCFARCGFRDVCACVSTESIPGKQTVKTHLGVFEVRRTGLFGLAANRR